MSAQGFVAAALGFLERTTGEVQTMQQRVAQRASELWIGCPVRVVAPDFEHPLAPWPFALRTRGNVESIDPLSRFVKVRVRRGWHSEFLNLSPLLLKPLPSKRRRPCR